MRYSGEDTFGTKSYGAILGLQIRSDGSLESTIQPWRIQSETVGCGAVAARRLIKKPTKKGIAEALGFKAACVGMTLWDTYQGLSTNRDNHELCVRRCRDYFPDVQ